MSAETETPIVDREETLVPARGAGASMLDRWVNAPDQAMERVDTMVRVFERLRVASIRATYPTDWIIHTSRDANANIIKQLGYLQDTGAERAGKLWGVEVSAPAIEREDFPDQTYSYHMVAEAWSKVTGERLDYVEGSRWSGDRFFQRQVGADDKIDPTDVRKSAYANLHGRAVRALSGLNGVPLPMLREAGLDITKVVMVDYEKGAKGGDSTGASVGTSEVIVGWGNCKGQKVSELSDKDLAYYIKTTETQVADPGKAKFAKSNQRFLDALTAERERRERAAAQQAETGTKAPEAADGEKATTRGGQLADLHTRLVDACKGNTRAVGPLLRALTKELIGAEKGVLSDLTDDDLAKVAAVPEDVLVRLATGVK